MDGQTPKSLLQHFSNIDDPLIDRTKRHKLIDILVIAICATICGAETWEDFELLAIAAEIGERRAKRKWARLPFRCELGAESTFWE